MFGMRDIEAKHPTGPSITVAKQRNGKRFTGLSSTTEVPPYYLFFVKPRSMWAACWEDRIRTNCNSGIAESVEPGDQLVQDMTSKACSY
jgi:hypothetical protein